MKRFPLVLIALNLLHSNVCWLSKLATEVFQQKIIQNSNIWLIILRIAYFVWMCKQKVCSVKVRNFNIIYAILWLLLNKNQYQSIMADWIASYLFSVSRSLVHTKGVSGNSRTSLKPPLVSVRPAAGQNLFIQHFFSIKWVVTKTCYLTCNLVPYVSSHIKDLVLQ